MATTTKQFPERIHLHPGRTRLDDVPIPEVYKTALKTLGYVSLEQVASAAQFAAPRLSDYLKLDVKKLLANLPILPTAPQISFATKTAKYKFGAILPQPVQATRPRVDIPAATHIPRDRVAPVPATGAFGSTPDVNLIAGMPPVRDQGQRGTCVAHAAVAAMEYWEGTLGHQVDLSEQFLYYNCKMHDGQPQNEGTFLRVAMPLLFTDGCCLESIWSYNPQPIAGNEGQGPPPANAASDAATRKTPGAKQLSPQAVSDIKDELAANRCVAVSVVVYDYCWFPDEIRNSGDVTMPFPGDTSNEGHAVCLVGYEDLPGEPELGGGRFILRNSWDKLWGVNCEFGSGYGTLPYAYLTTYGMEAYSIQ